MKIAKERCVGCANCVPVCPVGAIYIGDDGLSEINYEVCVECHNCYRSLSCEHLSPGLTRFVRRVLKRISLRFQPDPDVCPTGAIEPDELTWPRVIRRAFSDPMVTHESTGVHGRGTEEVKTNDVSGRIKKGDVGIVVEFGRPGVGVFFGEVQKATTILAAAGVEFEKGNPVAQLMVNSATGKLREDILDEKVLSCIVEVTVPLEKTGETLDIIKEICDRAETVISIGVSTVCDPDGSDSVRGVLEQKGYSIGWAKVNLGFGCITNTNISGKGEWI